MLTRRKILVKETQVCCLHALYGPGDFRSGDEGGDPSGILAVLSLGVKQRMLHVPKNERMLDGP